MKYARRRTSSSEGSSEICVTFACGEAEMCAVPLVGLGLFGFLAAVARRGVWRLPGFLAVAGPSEPGAV